MRRGRLTRLVLLAAAVTLALAVGAVVAYRVFAPQEILMRPIVAYPEAVVITDERPFSELRAAPLVVEGRLRVYAEKWRVWSDAPVGGRYEATPYWAYRRWPAQVVSLATVVTRSPLVVSHWSDGQVVAIDARSGAIAWRAAGPDPRARYEGRRTGATTVYEPASLVTARTASGTALIVTGPGAIVGLDAAEGIRRWNRSLPDDCRPEVFTGAGLALVTDCGGGPSLTLIDAATGRDLGRWPPVGLTTDPGAQPEPALCEVGQSECRLVVAGRAAWQLHADGELIPVPPLEPGSRIAGDRVIYPVPTGVAARHLDDKTPLWTWTGPGKLVAADRAGAYVLTDDLMVLGLSPITGRLSVVGCATSVPDEHWRLGHVHPTGSGYLALERLSSNADASDADQQYFYGPRPVALVELYPPAKLPVWPGRFAACTSP